MTEPILQVKNLVKQFAIPGSKDVVNAVNNVTFNVNKGEVLGLVGESGSGKTTIGRCIARLEDVTSGEIVFLGKKINHLKSRELGEVRSKLQMVFQDPHDSLNPRMTIGRTLDEPLYLQGKLSKSERTVRVLELLEMVRLNSDYRDKYPHQLTGGQVQRVGIARALATNPELIVLDEPTSVLDIAVRGEILDLLKKIQEETGVSYIFISHDLTAVKYVSHRIAIMYLGEIVELTDAETIFREQLHPYSKALLSAVLFPDPNYENPSFHLEGEIPSPINLPKGCFLYSRCPIATEQCKYKGPKLEEVRPNHFVACFNWK